MKNINEFTYQSLFCELGLYEAVAIDCTSFSNSAHEDYREDGYGFTVYDINCSDQFSRLIDFMTSTQKNYMYCPECNKKMSFESIAIQLSSELKKRSVQLYRL